MQDLILFRKIDIITPDFLKFRTKWQKKVPEFELLTMSFRYLRTNTKLKWLNILIEMDESKIPDEYIKQYIAGMKRKKLINDRTEDYSGIDFLGEFISHLTSVSNESF